MIERIDFLVEEPSLEEALRHILPSMLGDVDFEIYPFQGKNDLLKQLPKRLQGYSRFIPDTLRVVILVDRDDDDCTMLKNKLESFCRAANLPTRSRRHQGSYRIVNRILIEELEAWFFGDWQAVRTAFPKIDTGVRGKAAFRASDEILGGTWEHLLRLLQKAGYFKTGLRKRELASTVARHMDPDRNDSPSFRSFYAALTDMLTENEAP